MDGKERVKLEKRKRKERNREIKYRRGSRRGENGAEQQQVCSERR